MADLVLLRGLLGGGVRVREQLGHRPRSPCRTPGSGSGRTRRSIGAVAVPDTSTPSTTDSSRRSSSAARPRGRWPCRPRASAGAGTSTPDSPHRPRAAAQLAHVEHEGPAGVEPGGRPGGRRRSGWHGRFSRTGDVARTGRPRLPERPVRRNAYGRRPAPRLPVDSRPAGPGRRAAVSRWRTRRRPAAGSRRPVRRSAGRPGRAGRDRARPCRAAGRACPPARPAARRRTRRRRPATGAPVPRPPAGCPRASASAARRTPSADTIRTAVALASASSRSAASRRRGEHPVGLLPASAVIRSRRSLACPSSSSRAGHHLAGVLQRQRQRRAQLVQQVERLLPRQHAGRGQRHRPGGLDQRDRARRARPAPGAARRRPGRSSCPPAAAGLARIRGRRSRRGPAMRTPRSAHRRSSSRATSRSSTAAGISRLTSPPQVATSLTRLEDRKLNSGLVGMNSVSTPVSPWFIWAIFSS